MQYITNNIVLRFAELIFLEVIHPSGSGSGSGSHLMLQAWHHVTAELAQHCLEQLLVAVERIKAAAQFRQQAMVQVAHHAMAAACGHGQVAWLSYCCCSSSSAVAIAVAVAGNVVVEAGEAGHLLKCAGAGGGGGVHGGLELC